MEDGGLKFLYACMYWFVLLLQNIRGIIIVVIKVLFVLL